MAYLIEIQDESGEWSRWMGSYRYGSRDAAQAGVDRFNSGHSKATDPRVVEMIGPILTNYRIRAVAGPTDSKRDCPWVV